MRTDLLLPLAGLVAGAVVMLAGWLSERGEQLGGDPATERGRRRLRGPGTGVVLVVATLAGLLGAGWPGADALRLLAIALLLGGAGMLADRRRLRPSARLVAEAAAGLAAVALGFDTGITATAVTNGLLVVGFVVATVECVRLLDAAPRAAAVVSAPIVVAMAFLAGGNGQTGTGLLSAGLAGGLVGLVAVGLRRPFWLGESGALFMGFLVAGLFLEVTPRTSTPLGLVVVLPLIAIPLLNAGSVAIDHLRRRHPLTERRPDGFPHRLRAMRLSWPSALGILGGLQATVSLVVVLADRGTIPLFWPALLAAAISFTLLVSVRAQRAHRHKPAGASLGVRLAGVGLVIVVGALVVPAALVLVTSRTSLTDGANAVEQGLAAARLGDIETAAGAFEVARSAFADASARLENPLATPGLAVPVLGPNLASLRSISDTAGELAETGAVVATAAPGSLTVVGGRFPLEKIRELAPDLAEAAVSLRRAQGTVDGLDQAFLLPALRDKVASFDGELRQAADEAEVAAQALAVLPEILGADGPRRYFLMVQNNAELRATGGFMGNYGELVADDGRIRLERLGRHQDLNLAGPPVKVLEAPADYLARYERFEVASTWESVNLSPDLPTVGQVIAGLYPQSGGGPIDGVLVVDPVGLAGFLRLIGPIDVAPWPTPITAENVVEVTLNRAYVDFEDTNDRIDFLGDVAQVVADVFSTSDLGGPARILGALGAPASDGHLAAWFTRPEEQALADRAAFASRVAPVTSDSVLIVNQNAGGNKLDYYFRRSSSYEVTLRPVDGQLLVSASLRVDMENQAPAEGLPRYIIGPFDDRFEPGVNRSYTSLYSPLNLVGATWEGETLALDVERELGRNVYSAFLDIPPRSTRTLDVDLEGVLTPLPGGWYELDVLRQPFLTTDPVSVKIEVAEGWRIAEAEGATLTDDQRALVAPPLDRGTGIRLRVEVES